MHGTRERVHAREYSREDARQYELASPKACVRRISTGLSSPDLQGLREKLFINAGRLLRRSEGRGRVLPRAETRRKKD